MKSEILKVTERDEYTVVSKRAIPEGTVYSVVIDGHDFCIFESVAEKKERAIIFKDFFTAQLK